jgi:hypothetical protein
VAVPTPEVTAPNLVDRSPPAAVHELLASYFCQVAALRHGFVT